ncbi:MAG: MBL fold metallo-hydrolase [Acidobacteria bacterium]|nr:MBL fold metallo-hydrolase [Acidobacteriota bacterium]MDA1233482.1 MBL fold metallo-hydrolase [Acidobacteriota bacterium]
MMRFASIVALCAALSPAQTLDIYTIDVEGGKAVLTVSPSGESMLVDAGWPEFRQRTVSTGRIVEAAKAAGLTKIDYLLISHYDIDHIGDVPALANAFPIGHILDHGDMHPSMGERNQQIFRAYAAVREKIGHTTLKPGDKLPIKGIDVTVLTSAGEHIHAPINGGGTANPLCAQYPQIPVRATDYEDDYSVGLLYKWGDFTMVDLADLEAHHTRGLVCPANLIGAVDVYHVNVHGQFKGIAPEFVNAIQAPVMILGNGARKGADAETWLVLSSAPGLIDIWQVHESLNAGEGKNPPAKFLGNIEPYDGFNWIKLSVHADGTFTVSNPRNHFSKTYRR